MSTIQSVNPRTGAVVEDVAAKTSAAEINELAGAAEAASPVLDGLGRGFRAKLLRVIANELDAHRDDIVSVADRETAIGPARLNGELTRTVYQARLFSQVLDEGSYLEATIDHAAETPMGPGPDLRRMLVPIGPVAVFGSSNFPLAFSVPGGDTVSAIAAGSPVIIKAHTSHPATSLLTFSVLKSAARKIDAPEGVFGLVFGQGAGSALVADPRIKAVGFTGSLSGGRALLDVIDKREEPIPFYGELSSLNPVVVTAGAASARRDDIAEGIVNSFTVSAGQLCTKPGLVFVPVGAEGDALVAAVEEAVRGEDARVLLNERIYTSYGKTSAQAQGINKVERVTHGKERADEGFWVTPRLFVAAASELTAGSVEECFGPTTIVARYADEAELHSALAALPSSLTFTVHSETSEASPALELSKLMRAKAGRVVFNGYPTGVLVSWAQTHGGPWPATNSLHTSVGPSAIRRFLRPVTWQNAPEIVLPDELRDGDPGIPRRVDGTLVLPGTTNATKTQER